MPHLALLIRPDHNSPNRVDIDGADDWSKRWLRVYDRQVTFLLRYVRKRSLPSLMTRQGLEKIATALREELEEWGHGRHVDVIGHDLPLEEYTFSVTVAQQAIPQEEA